MTLVFLVFSGISQQLLMDCLVIRCRHARPLWPECSNFSESLRFLSSTMKSVLRENFKILYIDETRGEERPKSFEVWVIIPPADTCSDSDISDCATARPEETSYPPRTYKWQRKLRTALLCQQSVFGYG